MFNFLAHKKILNSITKSSFFGQNHKIVTVFVSTWIFVAFGQSEGASSAGHLLRLGLFRFPVQRSRRKAYLSSDFYAVELSSLISSVHCKRFACHEILCWL